MNIDTIKQLFTDYEKHPAFEGGYAVILKVGVQSFRLDYVADTIEEVEWMRHMLAKALDAFDAERKEKG